MVIVVQIAKVKILIFNQKSLALYLKTNRILMNKKTTCKIKNGMVSSSLRTPIKVKSI